MKRVANCPEDQLNFVAPEESSADKALMGESSGYVRTVIPELLILSRLARSEEMREFFIQMWIQNPELAKQVGAKVQSLMLPVEVAKSGDVDGAC